ncbi:MAG: CPBP family intramembrane metalloprotease [Gammaproteobacteria bacterium]|nr:CPBP family intramembrane metalloprotease [Gammaproteobacteria bacterium]
MPALFIFIAYFAIALLSGVAISYPLHVFLANWFELDFERVASRSVLIVAIILFMALYRKLGFSSWREIGYSSDKKQFFSDLTKGISFGILIMSPVIVGLLITKNRTIDMDWEVSFLNILNLVITALIAGLIIAFIEETLFRGAMLSAIKKRSSVTFAIIVTSIIYALVHFIQPDIELDSNTLNWTSGFILLKDALPGLADMNQIFDSFIALFLAGVLLSIVRIRTNRIALCIGIHAGWVIAIKVFKRVTDTNVYSDYAFLTGSYDKVIGYLAAVCIVIFILLLIILQNQNN